MTDQPHRSPAPVPTPGPSPFKRAAPSPAPDPADLVLVDEPPPPTDYDPADYRWVPVRRVPRFDGWSEEKQRRFIQVLADTGLVAHAAKAVGMSRESAYVLRRSAHGAAFAAAWDTAREHAAGLIEDIVFERAILGVEHAVYNDMGEVTGTRLVHDNRLLQYLLRHLRPDRYGATAGERHASALPSSSSSSSGEAAPVLEAKLRAMEPALPAPPEQLLTPDELEHELEIAETADGTLPRFLDEQRAPKSDQRIAHEAHEARMARGEAAMAKRKAGGTLTQDEFADENYCLDPISNQARRRPRD